MSRATIFQKAIARSGQGASWAGLGLGDRPSLGHLSGTFAEPDTDEYAVNKAGERLVCSLDAGPVLQPAHDSERHSPAPVPARSFDNNSEEIMNCQSEISFGSRNAQMYRSTNCTNVVVEFANANSGHW